MTQEEIVEKFMEYLNKQEFTKNTCYVYQRSIIRYMEQHNISDKQELTQQLLSEPNKIKDMNQVYKWLGVTPPYRRSNHKHKQYKTRKNNCINGYNVYNDPLIHQFQKERNVKDSTMQGILSSLRMYVPLSGFKNCEEMIQEALEDERNRIPIKEARITEHLRAYKRHLQDQPTIKTSNTLHTYFTKVETFYRHFQVTVPARPPMQIKKEYHINYYDLPDKKMIETAIDQSDTQLRAIIYWMSSSGTAKAETLGLTLGKFLEGLREYTQKTNPQEIIQELNGRRDLVPIISMTRKKTNVSYYTCCSSEATYYILQYLAAYKRYKSEEPLFEMTGNTIMKRFNALNDGNEWGRVGPYRKFRTHMLRKYHASNIGCSFEVINTLEGRTNGTIHETYVKQRPDKLKEVYMEHMHNVMIHPENFEGPHCGDKTIKGIVQEEVQKVKGDVGTMEPIVHPVTNTNAMGNTMDSMNFELIKTIGKLEQRIEQLENRLTKLGG